MAALIFTIGYSIRPIQNFIALLRAHKIQTVIDIRTIPKSSYCSQFNQAFAKLQRAAFEPFFLLVPEDYAS